MNSRLLRRFFGVAVKVFVMFLAALCIGTASAQQPAATKAAAASATPSVELATVSASAPGGQLVSCTLSTPPPAFCTCTEWAPLMSTSIMPPGGKDLFISFSAQTGLFTNSLNSNTGGASTTTTDENVSIQVRVLVDSATTSTTPPPANVAAPGPVAFDRLIRQTSQTAASDVLSLVLRQGGAHSFNFIHKDLLPGVLHTVNVQKRFCYNNFFAATGGTATASSSFFAAIGPRTLTVEQVNLDPQ